MAGNFKVAHRRTQERSQDPLVIRERFMMYVEHRHGSDCWWWIGDRSGKYGRFWYIDDNYFAHRASYIIHVGPLPDDMMILHSCDNKLCVNPAHLAPGTHKQNMADAVARKRMRPWNSKLTDEIVCAIRKEYRKRDGELPRLAEKYGTSVAAIFNIVQGTSWKRAEALPVYEAPVSVQGDLFEAIEDPARSVSTKRPKGEKHHKSKLTWELVRQMRREHRETGAGPTALGEKYGLGKAQVSAILRGKFWREP